MNEIMTAMKDLEIGALSGALISIRDIKRKMNNPRVDEWLTEGFRNGMFTLHRHDYPASLTQEEKKELLYLAGQYYVGVAIRQN